MIKRLVRDTLGTNLIFFGVAFIAGCLGVATFAPATRNAPEGAAEVRRAMVTIAWSEGPRPAVAWSSKGVTSVTLDGPPDFCRPAPADAAAAPSNLPADPTLGELLAAVFPGQRFRFGPGVARRTVHAHFLDLPGPLAARTLVHLEDLVTACSRERAPGETRPAALVTTRRDARTNGRRYAEEFIPGPDWPAAGGQKTVTIPAFVYDEPGDWMGRP